MSVNQTDPRAPLKGALAGQIAIVTGASRGIGAVSARAFARAGAAVVLGARDEPAIIKIAQEIQAVGGQAHAVGTDVSDPASVKHLVKRTLETYGRLDVAFNNAGATHMPARLAEITLEDFERCISVNLAGVFVAMKYEIAAMLDTGGGAIVNMSSTAGVNGAPGMGAYAATKHGVIGLTRSAAIDYAHSAIRVNAIAPGPILTEKIAKLPDTVRQQISRSVPMGRLGDPQEVAAAAVWLCSDHASFITGATLPIDGARTSRNA
ncbi:MAG: SDR family NAD(P)-dependent oxidoreductase [Solirubrobacteraceae bacterium]